MKKLIFLVIFVVVLTTSSCWWGPPWSDVRDVEYRSQLLDRAHDYCGVACVQMWSIYDGFEPEPTQDEIYDYIVSHYNSEGIVVREGIVIGVNYFTESRGYLVIQPIDNLGQDTCIAACIASIKDFRLAIVPFQRGRHSVLAYGYRWHYEDGMRIADDMLYHDPHPAVGGYKVLPAYQLKRQFFLPDSFDNDYWSIVGRAGNFRDGVDGYATFIQESGTFYGGPRDYDPRSFDFRN